MVRAVNFGTVVPVPAIPGQEEALAKVFTELQAKAVAEPEVYQWYASKVIGTSEFVVLDTFSTTEEREAHFKGALPKTLLGHGGNLIAAAPNHAEILTEILAYKINKAGDDVKTGLTTGVKATFTAKPEKKEVVRKFLIDALPLAEAEIGTISWYALHWPGTDKFGIMDFFSNDEAREAHLSGPIAAALVASVEELLAGPPDIVKLEVVSAKVDL
ncbi:hypothetical protein CPB84DRAFT_1777579 [Gymnopilus junonius]|uniref:ABM domain-containing protein n=1 Tax=Gymnopilus junonius TaxID=109634 RepID=A0A9P5NNH9_GYMJU|nr:hypothetical protein CPB84DRAFT_1777579 [Gymnopilus junonius]